MTSDLNTGTTTESPPQEAVVRPGRGPGARLSAYLRLAKLGMVDYYLSLAVVLSLLPTVRRGPDGASLLTSAAFLLGEVCLVAAAVAFDDVTGHRDGSDAANYGPDAPARALARKPLLVGTLTETAAVRFAGCAFAAGVLCWAAALFWAPYRPLWAVLAVVAAAVVVPQYSWGLRLSHRGLQEVFLAAVGWAFVLPLFGLLTGEATGLAAVEAFLFGLGPLLFGVYSNTHDAEGDRAVGRPTVACLLSPRGNRLFIGALSVVETTVIVTTPLLGLAPWWFPLAFVPLKAARARQFTVGMVRGDVLRGRLLGIRAHRILVVTVVVVNLLVAGTA
ncbi:UbiA family prenyltransferase [Streptomyces sp. NPDC014889]|uniref:UbiA family prenyltransferase n=1 Tax=Streptomyces sp. NPDC014889 TaxID=3364928 RepID=UPI0036FDA0BD